jgi:hypothetical protein
MMRTWPEFGRELRRYMQGNCCDLAVALSELVPGGNLVGIGGTPRMSGHVALRVGDLYLDARGLSDEAGFRGGLADAEGGIFPMTRDDALGQIGLAHMEHPRSPELTKARSVARRLARWHAALTAPAADAEEPGGAPPSP